MAAGTSNLASTSVISNDHSSLVGRRTAPDEVLAPSIDENYLKYRNLSDLREPYRISPSYLDGTKKFVGPLRPDTPLVAFINGKSGGRVGPTLAAILSRSLGQGQVYDVTEYRPDDVLSTLWSNLTEARSKGDTEAEYIQNNLRIVVAGGDGTVTWVLGTIQDLNLKPHPAVAVMPLGTGNDFSYNLGWGTKFEWSWIKQDYLYRTLWRYKEAIPRKIDLWKIDFDAPGAPAGGENSTIDFFAETPYSLQVRQENQRKAQARFWNYFSVGLDAEAAYGFHHLRETHPHLASGRMINQAWYSYFSCATGWFCGAKPLCNQLKLKVRDSQDEKWRDIVVPPSIRAVVLLNLQSYGGGRDIWGLAESSKSKKEEYCAPVYNDELIEVVGFKSGWHTALVMGQISSNIHATRLAQCREVRMELIATGGRVKGETGTVYMQLDGEPWPQTIPAASSSLSKRPLTTTVNDRGEEVIVGAPGSGNPTETVEPLRVHVHCGGSSEVLVNTADKLGTKHSQWVTARGVELSSKHNSDEVDGDGRGSLVENGDV